MAALMRAAMLVILIVATGPITGFAGRIWWGFELASHFRVQYYLLLFVEMSFVNFVLLGGEPREWGWNAGSGMIVVLGLLAVVHAAMIVPLWLPRGRPIRYGTWVRVVSLNLRRSNRQHGRTLNFLRDAKPDMAILLEVDDDWERALESLDDEWPHSHVESRPDTRGIAIFSRLPLDDMRIVSVADGVPVFVARVTAGGAPLTIIGAHPYPPISKAMAALRDRQFEDLARIINKVSGATVLVGDLNTTSWSPVFADLVSQTGLRDSRIGFGVQPTWPAFLPGLLGLVRIPLDHCLVSRGVDVVSRRVGPKVGSDHLPIIVNLTLHTEAIHLDSTSSSSGGRNE